MDAVKFLAEYNRMCNTYNDCVGCPMHDKSFCHPHDMTTNDERKGLVDAVEKWSKEHPIVTNGRKIMEMIPNDKLGSIFRNTEGVTLYIDKSWWDAEYKEKEQMGVYTNEVIGWLQINESTKIAVYKKMPNRFHRMMAKLLLGWVYGEESNE